MGDATKTRLKTILQTIAIDSIQGLLGFLDCYVVNASLMRNYTEVYQLRKNNCINYSKQASTECQNWLNL